MTQEETFSLLVPRYLREELSAAEKTDFESYLGENPHFQAEIDLQRNIMAARPEAIVPADLEFGWARLSRSIDNLETENSARIDSEDMSKNTSLFRGMWQVAALVLACISIGQAFFIAKSQAPENYQLASESEAPGITLQLSFSSEVNTTEMSDFLIIHNAQIITGPSKLGIYTLSFSDKEDCKSAISSLISKDSFVDTYTSCTTKQSD